MKWNKRKVSNLIVCGQKPDVAQFNEPRYGNLLPNAS